MILQVFLIAAGNATMPPPVMNRIRAFHDVLGEDFLLDVTRVLY